MERGRKRIEPNNEEIPLPESIIHDVQSRLSRTEAALTTVLSKSWYRAWITRPVIDLDFRDFPRNSYRFSEFARKTMRRYDEQNLNIETFRLYMDGVRCSLAAELVQKAVGFGANDIDIKFPMRFRKMKFILPLEVLGSEKLVRLSVDGYQCQIDLGEDGKVNCSSLKSLDLCHVCARGDVIWDIISSCPLIENLTLIECRFLYEDSRFDRTAMKYRYLDLGPFGFGKQKFTDNPAYQYVFQKLRNLTLRNVRVDPSFFLDFSSKFPYLKDLSLSNCLSPKKIQICSHSLEFIEVDQNIRLRAKIDVPNLRVFTCSSRYIPSLIFGTTVRQWESRIYAQELRGLRLTWIRQLKSFLRVMSISKLSLRISSWPHCRDNMVYVGCIKYGPVLDNLTIDHIDLKGSIFWDRSFWSCRPQLLTASWSCACEEFVSKGLTKISENRYIPNKSYFGQSDLDEVNVEVLNGKDFDGEVFDWEHVNWKTWEPLLDSSTVAGTQRKIRFHFRWGR